MARDIALLVDGDVARLGALRKTFKASKRFRVMTASDGREGLQLARNLRPSVIVLNADLPELDGLELLRELGEQRKTKVTIMLAARHAPEILRDARSAGVDHFFALPIRPEAVLACVCGEEPPQKPWATEEIARALLCEIGLFANLDAHEYLVTALVLVNKNPCLLGAVTKELYPDIARRCNTGAACVERSIRHAIGRLWKHGDAELLNEIFGAVIEPGRSCPTNRTFIAALAKQLEQRVAEWERVLGDECMER